jgi:hypothetical protein
MSLEALAHELKEALHELDRGDRASCAVRIETLIREERLLERLERGTERERALAEVALAIDSHLVFEDKVYSLPLIREMLDEYEMTYRETV